MTLTKQVSIFIAEDQLISRMGLKMLLEQTSSFTVVGEAEDGESAVQQVCDLKPDLVMMDLEMPKMGGIDATAILKQRLPSTKILIFTSVGDDTSIFAALKAGADGYCLKTISAEMLAAAIYSVLNGAAWLDPGIAHKVLRAHESPQVEAKVDLSESKMKLLALIGEGKNVDQIAAEMKVNDALAKGLLNELLNQLKGSDAQGDTLRSSPAQGVSFNPGDVVAGHYRIEGLLGEGGMGCVYHATHTMIGRKVAIKTLREECLGGHVGRERFRLEAQASAAISHPNLITIFDFGILDDRIPYMVMEYLEGTSLSDLLDAGQPLNKVTGINIFVQVCEALEAVHNSGVVHRDLKPSNIMLIPKSDGTYMAKILDFGIAKVVDGSSLMLTATGQAIGSPLFMSPEQCRGDDIDHRCDLYSLGCTMFAAFTGDPPFVGSSAMETCMKHVLAKPDVELLKRHKLPGKLIDLILNLLEKERQDRPASAAAVRQVLLKA